MIEALLGGVGVLAVTVRLVADARTVLALIVEVVVVVIVEVVVVVVDVVVVVVVDADGGITDGIAVTQVI